MKFSKFELKAYEVVRAMWRTFYYYAIKDLIDVDVMLVRYKNKI